MSQRPGRSVAPPLWRVGAALGRPLAAAPPVQHTSSLTRPTLSSMQKFGSSAATKELKDVLENKIEDLSRQLAEERQAARQNKVSVSRLQRELTRSKLHERHQVPAKEQLSRELEHEKMLRIETERRLHDMTRESEICHTRLESVQNEIKKMEVVVQDMMQYKSKIDQLKHEKSSLSTTYETSIDKFKGHITDLERENIMLLNQVKTLECQMSHHTDGRDRYKLLLERLRMMEEENSSLVLENEQQRVQYEKCMDEIANQVVQALLAQKMLREECVKLQDRVQDLELQNRQLCTIFQQQIKLAAEGNLPDGSVFMEGSMESLHSMFSEQTAEAGIPQMSSPPLWLQERLPGDRQSIVSFTGSNTSTPEIDNEIVMEKSGFRCRTEIETEFPATPSSPKSKHVSFVERKHETKRSSSTSSLLPPKYGPSRQRTRSTSSLSHARGLISPQIASRSHDSGIQNTATNEQSGLNQGKQKTSANSVTNHNSITQINVPISQSNPSIANHLSRGSMSQSSSKIPVLPGGTVKDDMQVRRHSLKAEYSIRIGSQSPAIQNSPSPNSTFKAPQPRTSTQASKSSSVSVGGQGHDHSRSPSLTSGRSHSAGTKVLTGSKIPTVSKHSGHSIPASKSKCKESVSSQHKPKTGNEKQASGAPRKIIPPKSPNMRYSGIRTTLKTDSLNKNVHKLEPSDSDNSDNTTMLSVASANLNLKTVYSISPIISSKVADAKKLDLKNTPIPVRGNQQVNHRSDSHFPIMGLTTLSHTSPKNDDTSNIYANVSQVPRSFSSISPKIEEAHQNGEQSATINTLTCGQYFYDYSDEDSDFRETNLKRPVSTDFSAASSVSLDELLDRTLENIDTPVDSDFSSAFFLYNPSQILTENTSCANGNNSLNTENRKEQNVISFSRNTTPGNSENLQNNSRLSEKEWEAKNRLMGKPDIVKDTEECEQRKLQQSLTLYQIPGSSLPGYRAKRPKSLILGAKEKKFLYCEYGSTSSSDSSDEEWRCKFSYAKNVKQHEIQTKVAKCVKTGEAKVIESPKSCNISKDFHWNKSKIDSGDSRGMKNSQLPKPGVAKKPSKIPPPVSHKPVHKIGVDPKAEVHKPRPRSVEICVNTAALSAVNSKTYYPYLHDSGSKSETERKRYEKLENPEMTSNTTFEDVKVERSGSKDDGYSTMSSDIQPENLEKYSDAFESSINSNEARHSNLSLSSQNSYSSEDRLSGHGSLGRVKAMKMKFEMDSQKSPERSPTKSTPVLPVRSLLKSSKSVPEKLTHKSSKESLVSETTVSLSKIPKPIVTQMIQNKQKSAIPLATYSSASAKPKVEVKFQTREKNSLTEIIEQKPVTLSAVTNASYCVKSSPIITMPKESSRTQNSITSNHNAQIHPPETMAPKHIVEQFNELTFFAPAFDKMEIMCEGGYDSSSSVSDRGSDLTSLHISEDNILSDIPEEKDGYESSIGLHSENTSFSSLPVINIKRPPQQTTLYAHSHHAKYQFTTTMKHFWSSCEGIVRAISDSDYEKHKHAKETADYDELYGGCLNIETLLERSSSESDMYTMGDKPEVTLLPRLPRSRSTETVVIDEIMVEEQLQTILKDNIMQQISSNVQSAEKDGDTFSSFVELLIERGHVLDSPSPLKEPQSVEMETRTALNKMTVSNFSSKEQNSSPNSFVCEEGHEAELPPLGNEQKKFNSQFYSLCNTGSNRSISEKSENQNNETTETSSKNKDQNKIIHTCQKDDGNCNKCVEERNLKEFDNISRQIETLSKTVNELHRSLSSLHSEHSDSGSESNEGDIRLSSAIGNKDIDGYQWVEDEFFLSPYGGEIILGSSPFSKTGASCDWINEYSDNIEQIEEIGGDEGLLEAPDGDTCIDFNKNASKNKRKSMKNSIIAESIDKEGNFDSHHFITRRLQEEEERRKLMRPNEVDKTCTENVEISMPHMMKWRMSEVVSSGPLLKEDLRLTQEKDTVDTERLDDEKRTELFEQMVYGGSQDSLDDNIGVDSVMCHRLLGAKRDNVSDRSHANTRPPLDFTSSQFVRCDSPEIQAMAAFDFLHDMSSSQTSEQSQKLKLSHDQLLNNEERQYVSHGYQNQMNKSTTSNESRISPVKKPRRKLRQRVKKESKDDYYHKGQAKMRNFSSTSADESNDEDVSLSDGFSDSFSSDDGTSNKEKQFTRPDTKMTYL